MTEAGHWLVRMESYWAGWPVCLPLLSSLPSWKSRRFLLAPIHPGWSRKKGRKRVRLCVFVGHSAVGPDVSVDVEWSACWLRSCTNRPSPFPRQMSYNVTKPGFSFYVYVVLWCMSAFAVLVLVFPVPCTHSGSELLAATRLPTWRIWRQPSDMEVNCYISGHSVADE